MTDKTKWAMALLIVGSAIVAFYVFKDQLLVLRVLGLLAALGAAIAVVRKTASGEEAWEFGRGALVEVRKVVWPSRKETTQTTLVVMAMVVAMGAILWMFDAFLGWAVKLLTGQGS